MTIIDNEITAREFKKIQWNKLSESLDPNKLLKLKLNLTSIIDQAISIELNDDNLLSTRRELVEFISICILKIKSILSIDNDITIEVGEELLNEEYSVPASFHTNEKGEFILTFSPSTLKECFCYFNVIKAANEKFSISNPKAFNEFVFIGGQKIMHLIHIIGHELYHARQEQEPEYAMKTKLNNIVGRFMIKNPNTHIAGTSKNPYQTDLGERSAEAFSIRYLKEMIKVVRSSGPKTLIERIILICYEVSYQDELNALKAKIIN